MSNSIDKNLNSGNNSMDSLSFYWMAKFENKLLFQFDNGKENLYKEVMENFDKLQYFHLYHKDGNKRFIVDLKKGLIKFNDCEEPIEVEPKENIRLIYFRRVSISIGEKDLKEKSRIINYHLGFQYNDKNENNRQIVLRIDEQGTWVIGE